MKMIEDLSTKEIAALDEDDLDLYVRRALMDAGVIDEPRPAILDEPDPQEVELPTETWYEVGGLCFRDHADAVVVSKLPAYKKDYDYSCGYEKEYPARTELKVAPVELVPAPVYDEHKEAMREYKSRRKERDEAREHWEKSRRAVGEIRERVCGAYREACSAVRAAQAIAEKFEEYVAAAEGNEEVAGRFLAKAYSPEQIKEAAELAGSQALRLFVPLLSEADS